MKLINKSKQKIIELAFAVGVTYTTKMQTAEKFTIDKIDREPNSTRIIMLWGRYEKAPHLINCPLSPDRLIPNTEVTGNVLNIHLCPHCNKEVNLF